MGIVDRSPFGMESSFFFRVSSMELSLASLKSVSNVVEWCPAILRVAKIEPARYACIDGFVLLSL